MQESREPIVAGGYLIRRVDYSPSGATNQGKVRRHFSTNNKENIPYGWRRSPAASRLRRPGRSPLPDWYPRTPLRDITSIVKAYEKRRLRIQAAAAQASAASPSITPQRQESSSTAIHHPLEPPMKACHIFTDVPTPPPASLPPQTPALTDGQTRPAEAVTEESPLLDSFEQIEKAVKRNMVTMKKPESKRATQLRSLMSMR